MRDRTAIEALELNSQLERARNAQEAEIDELNRLVTPDLNLEGMQAMTGMENSIPTSYRDDLMDSTAAEVHETLQNGLMAHLTPIGMQWATLGMGDEATISADGKHWLHYAGQAILKMMAPSVSNFYVTMARSYAMDGAFGTSVVMPRLSSKRRLVFDSFPAMSYCLAEDADGVASTLTRQFTLTASQMWQMFGEDCPAKIGVEAHDPEQRMTPHKVLQVIRPNMERDPGKTDPKNMPFESVFVEMEMAVTIKKEGFWEQPHAVSVWKASLVGPYGISPFSKVLPSIRALQVLAESRGVLVERAGNPPWYLPSGFDGKFDPRPFGINIGGKNADDDMPREMKVTGRLDYLQSEAEEHKDAIKKAGYYDMFRLLSTSMETEKTAFEVSQLMEEKGDLFHPVFARKTFQISQILKRTLAIALRAGLIAPPPESLLQPLPGGGVGMMDPEIQYQGKLARVMKLSESNALISTVNTLVPFAGEEGMSSEVFDWLIIEDVGEDLGRTFGVKDSLMRSPGEIEQRRATRAQAAEQAAMMQAGEAAAGAVNQLGGVEAAGKAMEAIEV